MLMSPEHLPPIILASGSPRRKELLAGLQIPFEIVVSDVDEKQCEVEGLTTADTVQRIAQFKGKPVADKHPDKVVIAADTLVALQNKILGKPRDVDEAIEMLTFLQGQTHSVFSAIAIFYQGQVVVDALETHVKMRPLTTKEIHWYVQTGEPMDKAGSYAIQGHGSLLVEKIDGCYFNVVGMSLVLLDQLVTRILAQPG